MKTLRVTLLAVLLASCHFDRLFRDPAGVSRAPPSAPVATTLAFTTQPHNASPGSTIQPPVQVSALDSAGHVVTSFAGVVIIALGNDASVLKNARLSGRLQVAASSGVASFADLSVDQAGVGYTLTAAFAAGAPVVESAGFTILVP